MEWSAGQYVAFEAERTRPVGDLLRAVPRPDCPLMLDLGCGPGNSTEVLAERFAGAVVTGLDRSPAMIAAARERLPGVRFEVGDIAAWSDQGPFGVILANASLQWVPDHASLLPRLAGRLAPGGSLAIQLPDNLGEPAQQAMLEVAGQAPWAAVLADAAAARTPIEDAAWYYRLLTALCARVEVWRTTYYHPLAGVDGVVDWFRGTGLLPFLAPLDPSGQAAFLARYRAALAARTDPLPDGTVLLAMPRLFIVATR